MKLETVTESTDRGDLMGIELEIGSGVLEIGVGPKEGETLSAGHPAAPEALVTSGEPKPKHRRQAPWLRQYGFKPGQSGNPKGRPRLGEGGKQDYRKLFREEMNRRGAGVVKACLDLAEQGDIKAIGIAMKYLLPEAKADSGSVDLELPEDATMEDRLAALVNKISTGEVSVEAGSIAARAMRDSIESAKTLEALQRMDTLQSEINAINKKGQGF